MARTPKRLTAAERADSLVAEIDALPSSQETPAIVVPVKTFRVPISPYSAVKAAAEARRMSVTAYIRRSMYAMAAFDLDIPVTDLTSGDPYVMRNSGTTIRDAEGTRFGSWQITGLEEHDNGA